MENRHADKCTSGAETPPDERSPLEFPCGAFIADAPGQGGAQAFCWFEDDAAVINHLWRELPRLYESDEAEIHFLAGAVGEVVAGVVRLREVDLPALNAVLEGLCVVQWLGSFDDLYTGKEPFERGIQFDFHENVFANERGDLGSDYEEFAYHLENYAG